MIFELKFNSKNLTLISWASINIVSSRSCAHVHNAVLVWCITLAQRDLDPWEFDWRNGSTWTLIQAWSRLCLLSRQPWKRTLEILKSEKVIVCPFPLFRFQILFNCTNLEHGSEASAARDILGFDNVAIDNLWLVNLRSDCPRCTGTSYIRWAIHTTYDAGKEDVFSSSSQHGQSKAFLLKEKNIAYQQLQCQFRFMTSSHSWRRAFLCHCIEYWLFESHSQH